LAYLGYIDQARSRLNEALLEARRLRHAQTLAQQVSNASERHCMLPCSLLPTIFVSVSNGEYDGRLQVGATFSARKPRCRCLRVAHPMQRQQIQLLRVRSPLAAPAGPAPMSFTSEPRIRSACLWVIFE
jgi:hypothetical protein